MEGVDARRAYRCGKLFLNMEGVDAWRAYRCGKTLPDPGKC